MEHIRAYLESASEKVTGWAKVELYKGHVHVAATGSPYSLFNANMSTFDADLGAYNHNASPGFIELWNLAQKTAHAVKASVAASGSAPPAVTGAYPGK
jgi:argininosuccinate synthase